MNGRTLIHSKPLKKSFLTRNLVATIGFYMFQFFFQIFLDLLECYPCSYPLTQWLSAVVMHSKVHLFTLDILL